MKKKLHQLIKIGILLFVHVIFFTSCEKEAIILEEFPRHIGKNPNEVSLDYFKQITNIDDIKSFVKKGLLKDISELNRVSSELTFSDFNIDTEQIYQCVLNEGGSSFSFHIEPIEECLPYEKFNLVIKQDELGEWLSKIYQLNDNISGSSQKRFSSIREVYSQNGLPDGMSARWVYMSGEMTTYHCTNTGPCSSGTCDNCSLCITTTVTSEFVYIEDDGTSLGTPITNPDFNYNGGGSGSGSSMPFMAERNQLIDLLDLQQGSQQYMWLFGNANIEEINVLLEYLYENLILSNIENPEVSEDAKNFVNEIIMLLRWEGSGDLTRDLNTLNFIVEAKKQDKIYNDIDAGFLNSVNQFTNLDTANPDLQDPYVLNFLMKMALLKALNPDMCVGLSEIACDLKIFWLASQEVVHIVLDGLGLVPIIGEVADLINGGLYLLEGDGVNATLSFAATIPFGGWAATGSKYAIKILEVSTIGTKIRLTWKVLADGSIYFGSSGSKLRKVLGVTDSALQAHHLMPWAEIIKNHDVIQKAAKSGNAFHMNEALNGIAVASWRNQPNHPAYTNLVKSKLDEFNEFNPNATVNEAYDFISNLISDIRDWVINNPNSHLNDLVLP